MNLIQDRWIKAIHRNYETSSIAPFQLTLGCRGDNPIVDIDAPRPDFRGALYQFLIGLLQTVYPPLSEKDWFSQWDMPPSETELRERFASAAPFFGLEGSGPAFMQDLNLVGENPKPIASLLIDEPGDNSNRNNLDHFVHRGRVNAMCYPCAATALFTLQTNAPAGGSGNRTGLRGGGPLTTLVLPDETSTAGDCCDHTLWHKVWLNVVPEKRLRSQLANCGWSNQAPADIFPWVGPTRTSETKTGKETFPEDAHPFQMYWGMPRRIRLIFPDSANGVCDICRQDTVPLVSRYLTRNYGVNYIGPWEHPLSPYNQPDQAPHPLPLHGQKGGLSYRNWLGLTLGGSDKAKPALTTRHFLDVKAERIRADSHARLWAFGYDMDNMKARCWYDALMPLYAVPADHRADLKTLVADAIEAAVEMGGNLRQEIRKAWYKRPKDVKGDWSFVDLEFWQATESAFYDMVESSLTSIKNQQPLTESRKAWHATLRRTAMNLFDRLALSGPAVDLELKRVSKARRDLLRWLNTGKKVKQLLGKG